MERHPFPRTRILLLRTAGDENNRRIPARHTETEVKQKLNARAILALNPVALLIFLPAPAWAGVVAPHFFPGPALRRLARFSAA